MQHFFCRKGLFFGVVNPDIRIQAIDIEEFLSPFSESRVAAVPPLVYSSEGAVEDSARRFPTFFRLFKRIVLKIRYSDYNLGNAPLLVD